MKLCSLVSDKLPGKVSKFIVLDLRPSYALKFTNLHLASSIIRTLNMISKSANIESSNKSRHQSEPYSLDLLHLFELSRLPFQFFLEQKSACEQNRIKLLDTFITSIWGVVKQTLPSLSLSLCLNELKAVSDGKLETSGSNFCTTSVCHFFLSLFLLPERLHFSACVSFFRRVHFSRKTSQLWNVIKIIFVKLPPFSYWIVSLFRGTF